MYKFTQMYKLQKELLLQLGQVAKDLQLQERQLWEILGICKIYLSSLQNKHLQVNKNILIFFFNFVLEKFCLNI